MSADGLQPSTHNEKALKTGHALDGVVYGFNILPRETCPGAGLCRGYCFASSGRYGWSTVRDMLERNTRLLLSAGNSVDQLFALLYTLVASLPPSVRYLRLHDSGDFFSAQYLEAWLLVMWEFPQLTFYCYTKSVPYFLDLRTPIPPNFYYAFSLGGKYDERIPPNATVSKVVPTKEALEHAVQREGWVSCSGTDGDAPLLRGATKIVLLLHGQGLPTGWRRSHLYRDLGVDNAITRWAMSPEDWKGMEDGEREQATIEIRTHLRKQGFPYIRLSDEEKVAELHALQKLYSREVRKPGRVLALRRTGTIAATAFFDHFHQIRCTGYSSPVDAFFDDYRLDKAIRMAMGTGWGLLRPEDVRAALRNSSGCATVANFRAPAAKYLVERHTPANGVKGRVNGSRRDRPSGSPFSSCEVVARNVIGCRADPLSSYSAV